MDKIFFALVLAFAFTFMSFYETRALFEALREATLDTRVSSQLLKRIQNLMNALLVH